MPPWFMALDSGGALLLCGDRRARIASTCDGVVDAGHHSRRGANDRTRGLVLRRCLL